MYRFENRSTCYIHKHAILDENIAIVDGDVFHVDWEDAAKLLNNPAPYIRWGKQGTMHTPDGDVQIVLVWDQIEEAEDPEDCCVWDDPYYLFIENEQLDRDYEEDRIFPERIYYVESVRHLDPEQVDRWFLSLSHYERYLTDKGYIAEGSHLKDYDYNAPIEAYRINVFPSGFEPFALYTDRECRKFSANIDGTIFI